jgi:hypothetical protein
MTMTTPTDTQHQRGRLPWGRLVLVAVLVAVGGGCGGFLGAWWTAPHVTTRERVWMVSPPGNPFATLRLVTVHSKITDWGSAGRPATYAGITLGSLLGWLVAASMCRLPAWWRGRHRRGAADA